MLRRLTRLGALIGAFAGALGAVAGVAVERGNAPVVLLVVAGALIGGGLIGFLAMRRGDAAVTAMTEAARSAGAGHPGQRAEITSSALAELNLEFNAMLEAVRLREADLADERERLRAVFSASTDPMLAVSGDTTVRFLNAAAEALLDEHEEDLVGRPLIEGLRDHELDALVRDAAAGEATTALVAYGPDRLLVRALAVPIPGGGDWAALLVLTDLTEVRRIDQVRTDFVANVSHELQTPLAAVQAMVETLEMGTDAAETTDFLSRIGVQTRRMTTMVRGLLDLSRIESGALELDFQDIPLAEAVHEAEALFTERIAQKGLLLQGLDAIHDTVTADRRALVRILTNLLDNAIRVSPEGATIDFNSTTDDELVTLSVSDAGPGIAPQDLERIFERFYKADASRSDSGTGLGLAIVKHLVQVHGGAVLAESEGGAGATFKITLPKGG